MKVPYLKYPENEWTVREVTEYEPFVIKAIPDLFFVIHKALEFPHLVNDMWVVSEWSTGRWIGIGHTKINAMDNAVYIARMAGRVKVLNAVQQSEKLNEGEPEKQTT